MRGKHFRDDHGIPIPSGKWADKWLAKPENHQHIKAATDHQKRMNDMYLPVEEESTQGGQV